LNRRREVGQGFVQAHILGQVGQKRFRQDCTVAKVLRRWSVVLPFESIQGNAHGLFGERGQDQDAHASIAELQCMDTHCQPQAVSDGRSQ
jgi:hypothetical protein